MSERAESRPPIKVRKPAALLSRDLPRYWFDDQPFATHFFNALSSTFPFGEAFFVRSVLHYRDRVSDPALLAEIRDFAAQEGQHSRIHRDHLELLMEQDYTLLEGLNETGDKVCRWLNERWPLTALTVTAGLEHLTSIMARQLLTYPDRSSSRMHPEMAALWRWHALEEAEHKSVAYDVMELAGASRTHRSIVHAMNSLGLSIEVLFRIAYMLWKDGLLFRRRGWRGGWTFLFGSEPGREGFLRGAGAEYWAWFRSDFHPEDFDDRGLIAEQGPLIDGVIAEGPISGGAAEGAAS